MRRVIDTGVVAVAFASLGAFVSAGCAATVHRLYPGPARPPEELARLTVARMPEAKFLRQPVLVVYSIRANDWGWGGKAGNPLGPAGPPIEAEILPGPLTLQIAWREYSTIHDNPQWGILPRLLAKDPKHLGEKTVSFTAEVGHAYAVRWVGADETYPADAGTDGKWCMLLFDEAAPDRPIAGP